MPANTLAVRRLLSLITASALLVGMMVGTPSAVRAVDPVTFFVGHIDEALEYEDSSDCASTTYWTDGEVEYNSDDDIVRAVVALASNGDTIHLCAGTWMFSSYVDTSSISVSIVGDGVDETIVDGGAVYIEGTQFSEGAEIFVIGTIPLLADMTIQHASGPTMEYGAIYGESSGTNVTVENVYFYQNASPLSGGAIRVGGTAIIRNSTFEDNSAFETGGAINASTVVVSDSSFTYNSTANGAGGAIAADQLTSVDSVFSDNLAGIIDIDGGGGGGAIASSLVDVSGGTFARNYGGAFGGAIIGIDVTIVDATFSQNTSLLVGGAVFAASDSPPLQIERSRFYGNSSGAGGAIFGTGTVAVHQSNFEQNLSHGIRADLLEFIPEPCLGGGGAIFAEFGVSSSSTKYKENIAQYSEGVDIDECYLDIFDPSALLVLGGSGGAIASGDHFESDGDTFERNRADRYGGAMASFVTGADGDEIEVSRIVGSNFANNTAGSTIVATSEGEAIAGVGGALFQAGGGFNVSRSLFTANVAGNAGGALFYQPIFEATDVRIEQNRFVRNSVGGQGLVNPNFPILGGAAALVLPGTNAVVARNRFEGNTSSDLGGGLYLIANTNQALSRNTFIRNSAARGGGLVAEICGASPRRVAAESRRNNTFSGNRARRDKDVLILPDADLCQEPG